MTERGFTPAAGRFIPTACYDAVAVLTRQQLWRRLVVAHLAPRDDDVIVDVGCGTGSLALMLAHTRPGAQVIATDPDPGVLATARRKAGTAGAAIRWHVGLGDATEQIVGSGGATAATSTLVLHQCPMPTKQAVLSSMFAALSPGGRLVIADYGRQRTRAMRAAFRVVQLADGFSDTRPNADGVVPDLIAAAGFGDVREAEVVPTVTGSISVYTARRS